MKLEATEMQDMGLGTLLSRVLQEVLHKGEIQLQDAGVEACIYVEQITKHVCILI
jgi:hypothetical protein